MSKFIVIMICIFLVVVLLSRSIGKPVDSDETGVRDLWKKVDQAEKDGLPRTAIKYLKRIYSMSLAGDQQAGALRAMVRKIVLESVIEGNHPEEKVNRLKTEIKRAGPELKPLMQTALAQWYWHYFSRNRWRFLKRSQTSGLDETDFTTWDLPRLFKEISGLYREILKDEARLKKIPVDRYHGFLVKGSLPAHLRPTLYDFVAHEALRFYRSGEQAAARPEQIFEVQAGGPALADSRTFLNWKIETPDPESPQYLAMRLYQQLMGFHKNDKNRDAFIDLDIQRLYFAANVAVGEDKSSNYLAGLARIMDRVTDSPLYALAAYYRAQELQNQEKLVDAVAMARRGNEQYPGSRGGQNCRALMARILEKLFHLKTGKVLVPGSPGQFTVEYKNIDKLHFRVVRDTFDDYLNGTEKKQLHRLPEKVIRRMLEEEPVARWSVDLKPTDDHRLTSQVVNVPSLETGFYRILASNKADFSDTANKIQHSPLWVNRVALVQRTRSRIREGYVLDAVSGNPLSGAIIKLYRYDYPSRKYVEELELRTDQQGYFRQGEKWLRRRSHSLVTVTARDLGLYADTVLSTGYPADKKRDLKTLFFTDRSLYRPGQMIAFKGICLELDPHSRNYRVIPDRQVTVSFRDANNQEIARQKLVSNKFGSFSGSFMAPMDRLTGRMSLVADSPRGFAGLRVEAYKRPKFRVDLKIPDREFRLDEMVTACGEARSYTGAPIDGSRVKFRVVREVRFPYWWVYWYGGGKAATSREIAHGTLKTDEDGQFCMTFQARPDRSLPRSSQPVFTYKIQAEVIDSTGETRGDETRIRLGYTAMQASLHCADWQQEGQSASITVNTLTLDGRRTGASGVVEIFSLEGPDRPVASDMIGELKIREAGSGIPEQPGMCKETPDWKKWPSGRRVFKETFQTSDGTGPACVLKAKLKAGVYRVCLSSRDCYDNPVKAYAHLLVFQRDKDRFPVKIPFHFAARQTSVLVGETFEAVWGSGYREGPVLIELFKDNKWLKNSWTHSGRTQGMIRLTVDEKLRGGFTVVSTLVKENRLYQTSTRIYVPWNNKPLKLQWQTFRSTLEPGQRETWSLKITGPEARIRAAEMVATLYDVSLDQYYPHMFQSFSGLFDMDNTALRSQFSNRRVDFSNFLNRLNIHYANSAASYDHFSPDVTQSLFGYQYGIRYAGKDRPGATAGEGLSEAMPPPAAAAKLKEAGRADDETGEAKKSEQSASNHTIDLSRAQARKNLRETAFFYPHLTCDEKGIVTVEFNIPEALTEWRFIGFAHTASMEYGGIEGRTVTRKDLMVQPNPPRFLREGDELEFTVKVTNMSGETADGQLKLDFFNPESDTPLDDNLQNRNNERSFSIPARQSRTLSFRVTVPDGLDVVAFRTLGATEKFADGEEGIVPVLSRRLLVRESIPLWISGKGQKNFMFKKLAQSARSKTLVHRSLAVQMTSNPAWYAVQALPYLMEYPHECSEQVFNRLYANGLARHIANSDPKIRRVFDEWKASGTLKSSLEKNPELKSVFLRESPWVRQAQNETQARHRVGLFFDDNRLDRELRRAYLKLKDMQLSDGSWPWFPGGRGNHFITLYVVTGFARLRHLGVDDISMDLTARAIRFLDGWILDVYNRIVARNRLKSNNMGSLGALYLYGRSFYLKKHPPDPKVRIAVDYFLGQAREYWLKLGSRQNQAQVALALNRFGDSLTARKIMRSIKERSILSPELGRHWRDTEWSWWWYRAPIETQAVMIEAFDEVMKDEMAVEECKIWLLKQKQARDWKTTKATADAVYAVLLRGDDLLSSDSPVEVSLGNQKVEIKKSEAGTGYYEKIYSPEHIVPEMGMIRVSKKDRGIAWGGVHWQYMEDISKITPHDNNPLKLRKRLFRRRFTSRGPVIEPLRGNPEVGDLLVVRIELRTDRDMEYVHLKDHRGSGMEPENVLSRYRYQDGLAYYESTLDTATHFFIDYLPKGTYVFEYPLRVVHRGRYQSGMAHIECMYAPEFNSHSESFEIEVK
jgi:hypothetical protein